MTHTSDKKIYFIGIGGIGVSALARYYLAKWYKVFGSDSTDSKLIHALQSEGCDIIIWSDASRIQVDFEKIIYSEAVPMTQEELQQTQHLWIQARKYNEALAEVVNTYNLIAVTGTHGKSTTSSMISQILKNSNEDFTSIVWTILKEFNRKNFYTRWNKNYFIIEACEYKEHFLAYKPSVAVITNIEYDHADYFKTPQSYIDAYEKFINQILPRGFCILNGEDTNCQTLIWKRKDIHYIEVYSSHFVFQWQKIPFPEIVLHIPGEHILFDAKLAYIVAHMIGIDDRTILDTFKAYSGVWRRMEKIGNTPNGNILMSDYGHHPTEIQNTLKALREGFPEKKLFVVFQPHQYSRTLELLDDFKTCFSDADILVIPDIYESRDSHKDKQKMNSQIFSEAIEHPKVSDGQWLENSLELIKKYDWEHPNSSIILLLGAGNIDNLRYKIQTM